MGVFESDKNTFPWEVNKLLDLWVELTSLLVKYPEADQSVNHSFLAWVRT